MKNLNENERKALDAIIETCDDPDGDMFTRVLDAVKAFNYNGQVAGGYISDLYKKGIIELEEYDYYGDGL